MHCASHVQVIEEIVDSFADGGGFMLTVGRILILREQQRAHYENENGSQTTASIHEVSPRDQISKPAHRGAPDRFQCCFELSVLEPFFTCARTNRPVLHVSVSKRTRGKCRSSFGYSTVCAIADQGNDTTASLMRTELILVVRHSRSGPRSRSVNNFSHIFALA